MLPTGVANMPFSAAGAGASIVGVDHVDIEVISDPVAYRDLNSLYRAFRVRTGETPGTLRAGYVTRGTCAVASNPYTQSCRRCTSPGNSVAPTAIGP